MTETNDTLRQALREIEYEAAFALQHQEENAERCRRHLDRTLAGIELTAHVARWGREGYPPPPKPGK